MAGSTDTVRDCLLQHFFTFKPQASPLSVLTVSFSLRRKLTKMMQVINALQSEIAELKHNNISAPAIVLQTQVSRSITAKSTEDRKFNIVVYGLKECEEGIKRHERLNKVTESAVIALKP